jgi:hypothetical protein
MQVQQQRQLHDAAVRKAVKLALPLNQLACVERTPSRVWLTAPVLSRDHVCMRQWA